MSFEKISFDSVLDDLAMVAVNAGALAAGNATGDSCCSGTGNATGDNCCSGSGSATGTNCCNDGDFALRN